MTQGNDAGGRDIGVCRKIGGGIEPPVRRPPFAIPVRQVMQVRVGTRGGDVRVRCQIEGGIEQRLLTVGDGCGSSFVQAIPDVMLQGIDTVARQVRIVPEIGGTVEGCVRRAPFRRSEPDVMRVGVDSTSRHVRVAPQITALVDVRDRIDRPGRSLFGDPIGHVVLEGIDSRGRDIAVEPQIVGGVEVRVRIASFPPARPFEMGPGIDARRGNVRVAEEVIVGIERAAGRRTGQDRGRGQVVGEPVVQAGRQGRGGRGVVPAWRLWLRAGGARQREFQVGSAGKQHFRGVNVPGALTGVGPGVGQAELSVAAELDRPGDDVGLRVPVPKQKGRLNLQGGGSLGNVAERQ